MQPTPVHDGKTTRVVWLAVPGVALHATARGIVVQRERRLTRVDLHDREVEREIVAQLAANSRTEERGPPDAFRALARVGALVQARGRACLDDLARVEPDLPFVSVDTTASEPSPEVSIVIADVDDPRLPARLEEPAWGERWVSWLSATSVVTCRDDGVTRGCPLCALAMDRECVDRVGIGNSNASRALGARGLTGRMCATLLAELLWPDRAPLTPGSAVVWNTRSRTLETVSFPPHPSCACATREQTASFVPLSTWHALEHARFAPIWPVQRATPATAARVVFRRATDPSDMRPSAFGVALASGRCAEARALAEGIERFAMMHGPIDLPRATASELGRDAWNAERVRALLFRDEDYARPDFRIRPYVPDGPLAWSWAQRVSDGARQLVPVSLVGRVPANTQRLVDVSSNGYACHRDRDAAVLHALLELIERDAILLSWYLGRPLRRLLDLTPPAVPGLDPGRVATFWCTQDIQVPVVLALACQDDGTLRSGAAADFDVEGAANRAWQELGVALSGGVLGTSAPPDLWDASRRAAPDDHLAHVAGPRGRAVLERLLAQSDDATTGSLGTPPCSGSVSGVVQRLANVGLEAWIVDRSLPGLFGGEWHVVRALVPGLVELSWGQAYRRLASLRIARALAAGEHLTDDPHFFA